ncbi:MAG TPA: 3,4-dihydroxy-2-butanone-4-phosphate synthase [Candidatus Atribacteria bacterium]|jgi:3,4-dihydroxy 2-butanone 4-phosphate synthase/GTP cyclohydrolase II|nr:3,4-dihydroxy-2-butanone-4-phosphate synthase [Candidatus Atribacteria bacterium]
MNEKIFKNIRDAIEDIYNGEMVVIVDGEDRENEGDLAIAAEKVSPEKINFMAKYCRGLICTPVNEEIINRLNLYPMVPHNPDPDAAAFTVSVDAKITKTGISVYDRAKTILTLIDSQSKPDDFKKPGHIFPLRTRKGGVLERAGHTEAVVDLVKLAGLYPAGVICEILNEDGTTAKIPELKNFIKIHNLKMITIEDLIQYRIEYKQ